MKVYNENGSNQISINFIFKKLTQKKIQSDLIRKTIVSFIKIWTLTNALESHLYRYEMQQASGIVTYSYPSNIYK